MALEMRGACEKCGAGLSPAGAAYICSHECTFCAACARETTGVCPNCGGELARRPRAAAPAAASCTIGA
ncbi:MAG TPA: DUF1272 domain-containing protein [Pyrinomonadaceae bacterium]